MFANYRDALPLARAFGDPTLLGEGFEVEGLIGKRGKP